eukprot:tig00020563_g11393.t1
MDRTQSSSNSGPLGSTASSTSSVRTLPPFESTAMALRSTSGHSDPLERSFHTWKHVNAGYVTTPSQKMTETQQAYLWDPEAVATSPTTKEHRRVRGIFSSYLKESLTKGVDLKRTAH